MPGFTIEPGDVCLYVTESCNSNCIMCPMSEASRKRSNSFSPENWTNAFDNIPEDVSHLTITGGEPFLQYNHLIPFIQRVSEKYPDIPILILTNGRALSLPLIQDALAPLLTEKIQFAIPIHDYLPVLHDAITQSQGSFLQTWKGLQFLSRTKAKIEVRLVGTQLNIQHMERIFCFLADSDLHISVINLIAMEVTGNAAKERERLWVDYRDLYQSARNGIEYAAEQQIDIGLYNFPLCSVPKEAWPLCKNSITEWKIRFMKACDECDVKDACGGMFYSVQQLGLFHPLPFREEP